MKKIAAYHPGLLTKKEQDLGTTNFPGGQVVVVESQCIK